MAKNQKKQKGGRTIPLNTWLTPEEKTAFEHGRKAKGLSQADYITSLVKADIEERAWSEYMSMVMRTEGQV